MSPWAMVSPKGVVACLSLTSPSLPVAVIYTTDNQNNDVTIYRHNIFVNGKVVTTYDKTLINNAKAVAFILIMLCLGSCSCPV
jgi:hypothetical protein